MMTFRDSPELTVTIFFEGNRIKAIHAMEPIPVPLQPLVSMGAAEQIEAQRR